MKKFLIIFILFNISAFSQPLPQMRNAPFEYPLNTTHSEYNPVISPDGKYIVFQSDRSGGRGSMDIWISENSNFKNKTGIPEWTEPVNLAELNTPSFEGMFSIRFDKKNAPVEIFFTSVRNQAFKKEGYDGLNIYHTKKNPETGKWTAPVHMNEINSNFNDRMPAISPDGNFIIFSSDRPGGHGGFDLWISKRDQKTGTWARPLVLGTGINTDDDEGMPYFHYDSKTLYYCSNHGNANLKFNIYGSQIKDIETRSFEDGYDLGIPFNGISDNEGLSLTHDGLWAYFSSNRTGSVGEFDIFRTQMPEELRNIYPYLLQGLVIDGREKIMAGLEATVKIYDETRPVAVFTSARKNGDLQDKDAVNFSREIKTGKFYRVEFSAPGYHPEKVELDLRGNIPDKSSKHIRVVLMPLEGPQVKISPDSLYAVTKDADTGELISQAVVKQFSDSNREGILLGKNEEKHLLQPVPEEEFELYAHADGYRDETLTLKKSTAVSPVTILLKKKNGYNSIYDQVILFTFNDSTLEETYFPFLEKLAAHLQKTGEKIEVGGHTDNISSRRYNIKLSVKRSRAVADFLVRKGVKKNQIKVKGYWYSKPVADNSTEEGRNKNRRVDFKAL